MRNTSELEYIKAGNRVRRVTENTVVIGVSDETLLKAFCTLGDIGENNYVCELMGDTGYRTNIYLVDGVMIEKTFPVNTDNRKIVPPFDIRIIAELDESGSARNKLEKMTSKLGLPLPPKPEDGDYSVYYDLSNQNSQVQKTP